MFTAGRRSLVNDDVIDDGTYVWPASPPDTLWAFGAGTQLVSLVPSEHLDLVGPEIMERLGVLGR